MSRLPKSRFFPPAESSSAEGLLLVAGRLTPEWLLDAYRHGIFPWPLYDGTLAWWSPDPRAIFELGNVHVPRRLARTCRSGRFSVTINQDFAGVIRGCATAQSRHNGTWITPEMRHAYSRMHRLGWAHSVEVWSDGVLAGGIYGVAVGGLFAGESMFYRVRDASKVALVHLFVHLRARGYLLFDIQQLTLHTQRFGAREIRRRLYLQRLSEALARRVTFGDAMTALS